MMIEKIANDEYTMDITDGKVDITDPCYDRDTWCAVWDMNVIDGKYNIGIIGGDGERVQAIWMKHPTSSMQVGNVDDIVCCCEVHSNRIGVDAGLCGFFSHKPDHDDLQWSSFCDDLRRQDGECEKETGRPYAQFYSCENGVFSSSGYGDGAYNLYLHKTKDGSVDGLAVIFIGDEGEMDDMDDMDDEEEE